MNASVPAGDFSPEVVSEICTYMNQFQGQSCAYIVQAAIRSEIARPAIMTKFNALAVTFVAVDDSGEEIRIPWSHPVSTRGEVRAELVNLFHAAIGL